MATRSLRAGFSLVEVLLAVLVLGLGLLGLAAVFPVVISQQRQSFDTVSAGPVRVAVNSFLGSSQFRAAWSAILNDPGFNRFVTTFPTNPDDSSQEEDSVDAWVDDATFDWETAWEWDSISLNALEQLEEQGDLYVNLGPTIVFDGTAWSTSTADGAQNAASSFADVQVVSIPIASRLFPAPFSGAEPQFVWDAVARRTINNELQLAVFIRRIDTGIRPPSGFTLSDVLTGAAGDFDDSDVRLPIGIDARNGRSTGAGAPLNSNSFVYSLPVRLEVELEGVPSGAPVEDQSFDQIVLTAGDDVNSGRAEEFIRRAASVGQFLVDNLGVVRRVVDIIEVSDDEATVQVEPGYLSTQVTVPGASATPSIVPFNERANMARSVVFTPQIPAVAPTILTIAEGS
ncbi:MAG: prepilin-type N-terminal cleavage/methylation domain-containing protein [Planctomycetota bacterium]